MAVNYYAEYEEISDICEAVLENQQIAGLQYSSFWALNMDNIVPED